MRHTRTSNNSGESNNGKCPKTSVIKLENGSPFRDENSQAVAELLTFRYPSLFDRPVRNRSEEHRKGIFCDHFMERTRHHNGITYAQWHSKELVPFVWRNCLCFAHGLCRCSHTWTVWYQFTLTWGPTNESFTRYPSIHRIGTTAWEGMNIDIPDYNESWYKKTSWSMNPADGTPVTK